MSSCCNGATGYGTFDAREARVAAVFRTQVQSVDTASSGCRWSGCRRWPRCPGEATLVTLAVGDYWPRWQVRRLALAGLDDLLADIRTLVRSKMLGSMFVYAILVFLAMLAIFDTRVFAIFKRQREIGTLVALGMTRRAVAAPVHPRGRAQRDAGLVLAGALRLAASGLVRPRPAGTCPRPPTATASPWAKCSTPSSAATSSSATALIILVLAALVSFLPTRRITRVAPTDALRGRVF